MFHLYTEKARRAIFFARNEGLQLGSTYIESEHLLLGLLRENKALTDELFASSPTAIDKIRRDLETHRRLGEKSPSVDLPLSEQCKHILAYASEESERLSHKHIGTEHLILGILREPDCYACHLLHENGVTLEGARAQVSGAPREEGASPPSV
jgi:ATP-dependent Clp protease ATP-binding subunit ClpC